jgi:hypothetical protein
MKLVRHAACLDGEFYSPLSGLMQVEDSIRCQAGSRFPLSFSAPRGLSLCLIHLLFKRLHHIACSTWDCTLFAIRKAIGLSPFVQSRFPA